MKLEELDKVIDGLVNGLPDQVHESLEEVEILVCETPEDATAALLADARELAAEENRQMTGEELAELTVPADCKGLFFGDPMEKTEDTDPDAEESDVVYDPEGCIIFCASNIEDTDAAVLVFLHEVGHALGLSESEVGELGMAVTKAAKEGGADATQHAANG
jgi:predicted Zn-dependent protease with MMP-like domain